MDTIALYDNDAFAKEFNARVVDIKNKDNGYDVVLDRTLFFPEQGGQTSDRGELGGCIVEDVQINCGIIHHIVSGDEIPFNVGDEINGRIDWNHRFNNMQQHTGEHIFTGIAHNIYGAENVGFHLSDNTVTLDLDVELTAEQVNEIEYRSNEIIAADLSVRCYYPDADSLRNIQYRSKKEINGAVRLVEIENTDICACCAPHVNTTGQVGILKVISFGKYKSGTRVFILCGLRALADYNRRMSLLEQSYQLLNCKEDQVPEKIRILMEDNRQQKYDMNRLKSDILLNQIEGYPSELMDVTIFMDGLDSKNMRDGVNTLIEKHQGLCAIFSGNDEEGYSFVIGSVTRDCNAIVAGMRQLLGAKGGGSRQMVQGSVSASRNEIERVL